MIDDRQVALKYLRAPGNACWRWADHGSVLVWHDGTTIAFREEIALVLEVLAPQGFPPFDALALLLAACKGRFPKASEALRMQAATPSPGTIGDAGADRSSQTGGEPSFEPAIAGLRQLRQLPPQVIGHVRGKAVLAQAVFETAAIRHPIDPSAVLRGIREPFSDAELNGARDDFVGTRHLRHLEAISRALKVHTPESLTLRLRTGLDALPKPVELKLTPAERARRLLDNLSKDDEHRGLARAARELLAAIRLPRRLEPEEALPLGGVADLSNRGPLDRLLVSELAHDDFTLAVRIALKEALYLRREPPVREPPSALALLLDSGVRLWGLPRVFATAVALALAAREKRATSVNVWRAHGKKLAVVDLLTKAGLTQHLGELETPPHPGEALTAFREALRASAFTQSVLITHRDAVGDPEFRRALEAAGDVPDFLAVVDREGHFELHALPLVRSQPLCSASLDLETIFAERKPAVSLVDRRCDPRLPVIFQVRPFPFLLPVNTRVENYRAVGAGGVCVTEDARLLLWRRPDEGARQLAAGIPGQHTVWLHADEQGRVTALRMRPQEGCLWIVRAEASTGWQACRNHDYLFRLHPGFFEVLNANLVPCFGIQPAVHEVIRLDHGIMLLIGPVMTIAIDVVSGETLSCQPTPPELSLAGGRYYFGQDADWHFVSWNGNALIWEPVSLPPALQREKIILLFDREGCEGPLAVTGRGAVLTCSGECVFEAARGWDIAVSSRDGHRLLVREATTQACHKLDLKGGVATVVSEQTFESAKLSLEGPAPTFASHPLWSDFRSIHARAPGILALYRSRREGMQLGFNAVGVPFITPLRPHSAWPASNIHFRPIAAPPDSGCTLQVAEWPNGSRAYLDSRGLLHLRSHDPSIAEVTIVLAFGPATVWSSDGLICGPRFFVGDAPTVKPKEMRRRITAFVDRLW